MVVVRVYVEGGGDTTRQGIPLRDAVRRWIERALPSPPPRGSLSIIACGGRAAAFEDFTCGVLRHPGACCVLLVDSEAPVMETSRWEHMRRRAGDGWEKPRGLGEHNLHFMAQAMEAWLCADPAGLEGFFGPGFKRDKLPGRLDLEEENKADLNEKLEAASMPSKRGRYRKGLHFSVLGAVDPKMVQARCRHARFFVDTLSRWLCQDAP